MSVLRTCAACGYTARYSTVARADAHHRRHSCARHREIAEQGRRRAERAAGRVRRDCAHPRAAHVHGTRAAYVKDRCRCPACTAANTAASRAVSRAQAFGRWHPFIDAGRVREHLRALRAAGIGVERIAALSGVATSHVRALAGPAHGGTPPIGRVRPDTARRLLAVSIQPTSRAQRSRVDATGTRRRLQALIAMGWSEGSVTAALHRSTNFVRRSMTSHTVTARTAAEVDTLYRRLCLTSPPRITEAERAAADTARAHAARQGWRPPLAWDAIDTDPQPVPGTTSVAADQDIDEIAIERATAGDGIRLRDLSLVEQQEVIQHLTARGRSIREIAEQLATTKRTVSRRRASLKTRSTSSTVYWTNH